MKRLIGLAVAAVLLAVAARPPRQTRPAPGALSEIRNESLRDAPNDHGADSSSVLDRAKKQVEDLTGQKVPEPAFAVPVAPAKAWGSKTPAAVPKKEWTVMLYINGKNDAAAEMLRMLKEAAAAGSSDKINIVAEIGLRPTPGTGQDQWAGVRRYFIPDKRSLTPRELFSSEDVADPAIPSRMGIRGTYRTAAVSVQQDMGDWRHLTTFIEWAKERFPAKKYMLFIGAHGHGWVGLSQDEASGRSIDPMQLAEALREAAPIDVVALDSCLMQMAEVVYELKDSGAVLVGSESRVPIRVPVSPEARLPESYRDLGPLLAALAADPGMEPEAAARSAAEAFARARADLGVSVTFSAVRTAAAPEFRSRLNDWIGAVGEGDERARAATAASAAYEFVPGSKDLYQLVRFVRLNSRSGRVRAASQSLMDFIARKLVISDIHVLAAGAHGLAVYFPHDGIVPPPGYQDLSWSKDTKWGDFIAARP